MKKLGTLLISLVLSLTIVYLGAGTVIVECLRNNTVTIGANEDKCCDTKKRSTDGTCMKTTVVKLQPTVSCKESVKILKPLFSLMPFLNETTTCFPLAKTLSVLHYTVNNLHAPPRLYLAIIRILII